MAADRAAALTLRVTLFDLDGVLCRTDTMAALIREVVRGRPLRAVRILPLVVAASASSPSGERRPAMNRAIVRRALAGLSRAEYDDLADRIGKRLVASGRADVDLVAAAAREGDVALVVTASERRLARAFLDECGLAHVPLVASEFCWTPGGPTLAEHNVGSAKIASVRRVGRRPEDATFFTDSASDLPLARVSREVILVRSSPRSRRAFRRAGIRVTLRGSPPVSRVR